MVKKRNHFRSTQPAYVQEQALCLNQSAENKCIDTLKDYEKHALSSLTTALLAMENLAEQRCKNKLSTSRVGSVARELKELIKVVSIYCC